MSKTMRITDAFGKFHNLMLVLFMMKAATVAIAFRALLVCETAIAGLGLKKERRVRTPKGRFAASMSC
jgi:hypothetical protein